MKKATFTVNGKEVTFSNIIAVIGGDELEALLIHDEDDTYSDGDLITLDAVMPEDDEGAVIICEGIADNVIAATDCFKVENGKYIVND